MDIAQYIPVGYKNAISREQLRIRCGLNDRQMRDAVKQSEALICNLQDGKGYFIPAENEERYVRMFRAQESRRSLTTGKTVKKCDEWIRKIRKDGNDLNKNQLTLADWMETMK